MSTPAPAELERFFTLSTDLLATVGADGHFMHVNPAWERALGWTQAELAGRCASDLVHPADRQRRESVSAHVGEPGYEIVDFEHRFRHGEGGWRWLSWSACSDGSVWYVVAKDVTDRRRLDARIFEDPLTKLPTRGVVVDRLKHARARQSRTGLLLAVMFVDLDGFKAANDSFGQALGDRIVVSAARRLRELVRACDTIARVGGDEFIILAEGVGSLANAAMVADRIVTGFLEPLVPQESLVLTASVGVALADADRHCTAELLLREADTAMDQAKTAGGSRFVMFDTAPRAEVVLV
jgi:diguanylate cyclase (GGDEF)-like protein/PAS domain S-box-containing protein